MQSKPDSGRPPLVGLTVCLLLVLAVSTTVTLAASGEPVDWCALVQGPDGGYVSCGYATRAQCVDALSGVGGICHENPDGGPLHRPPAERGHRRNRT